LLLGLIIIDFLLTFIVPSGVARMVIMAPICIGVINLFGVERGSNIGRGIFLVITYATAIFDKMIIAGTGAITARGIIERLGGVDVTYSFWLIAFLPCSLLTIFCGWRLTLWMFPPEIESLEAASGSPRSFPQHHPMDATGYKATLLIALALFLWLTDWWHGISAAMVAFGIGLMALLPFIDVLDAEDFRKANMLPFFFVACALGMSEVLRETGGLALLTNNILGGMEPFLENRVLAVPVLYWTAFVYHFFTASEISMLATSLPVLMEFSKSHALDRSGWDSSGRSRRRQAVRLSVRASGGRLCLWLFPPHGFDQARRHAHHHRICRSGALRRRLVAAFSVSDSQRRLHVVPIRARNVVAKLSHRHPLIRRVKNNSRDQA